jgi:dTDP-4-dehydrorhamnose 3,5-epimerase
MDTIDGVTISPLKIIPHPKGDILHALKAEDETFHGFGEAYFSKVNYRQVKGWKKHNQMTLNIVVPVGEIKFVIYDDRQGSKSFGKFYAIILGKNNYQRITVSPNLWMAFQGIGEDLNLLLNIANIQHDPNESINKSINQIEFEW